MIKTIFITILIGQTFLAGICYGGNDIIGNWSDKNTENVYVFKKDKEFEFYHLVRQTNKNVNINTLDDNTAYYEMAKGVWSRGNSICWSGTQKGDLMIYVDENQCCLMTQVIAGKLVLSEVFSKGYGNVSICENRVLNRIKKLPEVKKK